MACAVSALLCFGLFALCRTLWFSVWASRPNPRRPRRPAEAPRLRLPNPSVSEPQWFTFCFMSRYSRPFQNNTLKSEPCWYFGPSECQNFEFDLLRNETSGILVGPASLLVNFPFPVVLTSYSSAPLSDWPKLDCD